MTYALEYSDDGERWSAVQEKYHCADAPVGSPFRRRPVNRERLQDIQREAEFHSHRYAHVRIKHPQFPAPEMRDNQEQAK